MIDNERLNKQLLFSSLQRLNAFPLDDKSVFSTLDELNRYVASGTTAYEGQLVSLTSDENIYMVVKDTETTLKVVRVSLKVAEAEEIALRFATQKTDELRDELTPKIDKNAQDIVEINEKIDVINTDIKSEISKIKTDISALHAETEDIRDEISNIYDKLGGGGNCVCPTLEPYSKEQIENLFNEINGDCQGVVDPETVIESIPSNVIDTAFNEINGNCQGVVDPETVIESIPSNVIDTTFNEINGTCGGVVDSEPVIESIPSNVIDSTFNEINGECNEETNNEEITEPIPQATILSLFNEINEC